MILVGGLDLDTFKHACRAQKGSHLANRIRPPEPLRAEAQTSPYPHTDARFPTNFASVARVMPSLGEGTKMSNSDMTTQTPVKYWQLPRQPPQGRVAPRRQVPRVPSPSHTGVFGPPSFCALPTLFRDVAVGSLSLWVASPGVLSQPPASHGRFLGRHRLSTVHHCPVPALPLTQSPKGGSQRCRITRGVPTPRLLGESKEWRCFGSQPCFGS